MKLVGLWCLVVALVARGCLVKAECCWDSDLYAELKCDPDKSRGTQLKVGAKPGLCGFGVFDCCKAWFCNDGSRRVGSYCGKQCNIFGCNCKGGCITKDYSQAPPSRRLKDKAAQPSNTITDATKPVNKIAECQLLMVSRFDTYSLTTPLQVREYFKCLSTNGDNVLDARDESYRQVLAILGKNSSALQSMDADGDGVIDGGEFDPMLAEDDDDGASATSMGRRSVSAGLSIAMGVLYSMICVTLGV